MKSPNRSTGCRARGKKSKKKKDLQIFSLEIPPFVSFINYRGCGEPAVWLVPQNQAGRMACRKKNKTGDHISPAHGCLPPLRFYFNTMSLLI